MNSLKFEWWHSFHVNLLAEWICFYKLHKPRTWWHNWWTNYRFATTNVNQSIDAVILFSSLRARSIESVSNGICIRTISKATSIALPKCQNTRFRSDQSLSRFHFWFETIFVVFQSFSAEKAPFCYWFIYYWFIENFLFIRNTNMNDPKFGKKTVRGINDFSFIEVRSLFDFAWDLNRNGQNGWNLFDCKRTYQFNLRKKNLKNRSSSSSRKEICQLNLFNSVKHIEKGNPTCSLFCNYSEEDNEKWRALFLYQ